MIGLVGDIFSFVIMAGVVSLLYYAQFIKSRVVKPYLICLYEGIIVTALILYSQNNIFIPLTILLFFFLNDRVKEKAVARTEEPSAEKEKSAFQETTEKKE